MPAAIPTTYTGDSWENVRVQLVYAFDAANGRATVNGIVYPYLTNGQAIALMQAWRKMLIAYRQTVPASHWPELWYRAFGYLKDGDKFDMTIAHGQQRATNTVIAGAWEFAARAAALLDGIKATPRLLVLNFSYVGYTEAAKDAYAALKKSRAKSKTKTKLPVPPGIDPPDVTPAPVPTPPLPIVPGTDRGTALLVLLVLVAIATAKRKGK